MIENRKIPSDQASYFHYHEERNKTVIASSEKTYDEVNLPGTTNNITKTQDALNSSNNLNTTINAFNIDLNKPIPSSPCPSLLISDSEKKKILEIEAQLADVSRRASDRNS